MLQRLRYFQLHSVCIKTCDNQIDRIILIYVYSINVKIIIPIIDTPMNRKFMPDADHSKWTPLQFISDLLFKWSEGVERPTNGSLVQLVTTGGETQLVCN